MKLVLLMALLSLMSCGNMDDQPPAGSSLGSTRAWEPQVPSDSEASRIKSICNSLASKQDRLSILLNTQYTFEYAQRDCGESSLGSGENIQVSIERPYGEYIFEKIGGGSFAFPDVETSEKGVMAEVCSTLSKGEILKNPIQISSTGGMWFTTFPSQSECAYTADEVCIKLEKGTKEGSSYKIHTVELIKFKLLGSRRGFFTERSLTSYASCPEGKSLGRKAVLK